MSNEQLSEINPYELMILKALQLRPMYQGTADAVTVQERRVKNRVARKQRKRNARG
jgi:hypothetical protein